MADYRLSAQIISRARGQSSIASAAYRAAARLDDPRTGEIHDYTRKAGVVYSAILAPESAPDWMRDRSQLWQAVEAAEKRRDAQLARELQLSLPHELTPEQRQALLVGFVREHFVDHGMIADVAIHAPGREGDARNHHAHVMLTMRSLTGEGFGPKVRDWNDADTLARWREGWAHHQNRELERHGHAARVDHRSLEARGIDREPSQHLGPKAADMERNGKRSRIADENRAIEDRNTDRARTHGAAAVVNLDLERERRRFDEWARVKKLESEHAQALGRLDLAQKHDRQKARLDAELRDQFGAHKATISGELAAAERRLAATGLRRIMRDMLGRTRSDEQARANLARTLQSIEQRERERRQSLEMRQAADRARNDEQQRRRREALALGIEKARERREAEGWKTRGPVPASSTRATLPTPPKPAPPRSVPFPSPRLSPAGMPEPAARKMPPTLPTPATSDSEKFRQDMFNEKAAKLAPGASEVRAPGTEDASTPTDQRPSLARPWRSAVLGNEKPWKRDTSRDRGATRERKPGDDDGPKNKGE